MASWEDLRIVDVIEKIQRKEVVLPVIQRELVWDEEKIELLFDTALRGDSFGAIMTLKDWRNKEPLFEFRPFIEDYTAGRFIFSTKVEKLSEDISYVVDGQQRLSAFYIGLTGSYNGKDLYFDLFSEWDKEDFYLQFVSNPNELKKQVDASDGGGKRRTLWYRVKDLHSQLKNAGGQKFPTPEIFKVYIDHPLHFKEDLDENRLDDYDFDFLMYIIYGKKSGFRREDIDHIHPYSILESKGFSPDKINTIANYQLLDYGINRGDKNNKELKDWISGLTNRDDYLRRHLIPNDENLWVSDNYEKFVEERKKIMTDKSEDELNI